MLRLTFLLLLLFVTYYQLFTQATVSLTLLSRQDTPSNCDDTACSKRSLFAIIWDCLLTTIICAWNAVHPNIPPKEGPLKGTLRRVELMLWTIMAPEILPCWALKQLLAAREARDVYNKGQGYKKSKSSGSGTVGRWLGWGLQSVRELVSFNEIPDRECHEWTTRHGFFLIMGGFHLIEPPEVTNGDDVSNEADSLLPSTTNIDKEAEPTPLKGRVTILTLELLKELVKSSDDQPPEITSGGEPTEDPDTSSEDRPAESRPAEDSLDSWLADWIIFIERLGDDRTADDDRLPSEERFHAEDGPSEDRTLTEDKPLEDKLQVTEDDIADKSKGDALSKFIFILKSSWFIAQCIMRRVQRFDLTQIELTTLALANLNAITFLLWWYKPLGAQTPIRVYLKRKLTDKERKAGRDENSRSSRSKFMAHIKTGFVFVLTKLLNILLCRQESNFLVAWLIHLPFFLLCLLLSPVIIICMTFIYAINDLLLTSSFPADATRVPTFYAPAHHKDYLNFLLLLILGSLFGGILCVGWDYVFPSGIEQVLWRIFSLAVTATPIVALMVGAAVHKTNYYHGNLIGFLFLKVPATATEAGTSSCGPSARDHLMFRFRFRYIYSSRSHLHTSAHQRATRLLRSSIIIHCSKQQHFRYLYNLTWPIFFFWSPYTLDDVAALVTHNTSNPATEALQYLLTV